MIGDLKEEWMLVESIQDRIYEFNDAGLIKTSEKGTPYNRYAKETDYSQHICLTPTYSFTTPLVIFNQLEDDQKEICNAIKGLCNSRPTAFFWHNGDNDPGCENQGLHIHLICQNTTTMNDNYRYGVLKRVSKKHHFTVKYMKVRYLDSILAHMSKPPRRILGCNNPYMCGRLMKDQIKDGQTPIAAAIISEKEATEELRTDDGLEEHRFMNRMLNMNNGGGSDNNQQQRRVQEPTVPQNNIREVIMDMAGDRHGLQHDEELANTQTFRTKLVQRIAQIKAHMRRWNKRTQKEILREIYLANDMDALDEWRSLVTTQFFPKIWAQALEEMEIEEDLSGYSYMEKIIQECPVKEDVMSIANTADLFQKWCREQNISPGVLCLEIYAILGKVYPKTNTLALMGQSNAGKTYWASSFLPFEDSGFN